MSRREAGRGSLPDDPGGGSIDRDYFARRVRFEDDGDGFFYGDNGEDKILTVEKMANELKFCHDMIEKGRQVVQKLFLELTRRKRRLQEKYAKSDRLNEVEKLIEEINLLNKALHISHIQKEEYIKQLERLKGTFLTNQHQLQNVMDMSHDDDTNLMQRMDAFHKLSKEQEMLINKLKTDNESLWTALTNLQSRMETDRSLLESPDISARLNRSRDTSMGKSSPGSTISFPGSIMSESRSNISRDFSAEDAQRTQETSSLSRKLQKLLEQSENVQKLIATVGTKSQCNLPPISKVTKSAAIESGEETPSISGDSDQVSTSDNGSSTQCTASPPGQHNDRHITVEDLLKRCKEIEHKIKKCSPEVMKDRLMRHYEMLEKPVKIGKMGVQKKYQGTARGEERTKSNFAAPVNHKEVREELLQCVDHVFAIEKDFKLAQNELGSLKEDLHVVLNKRCALEMELRREVTRLRTAICSKDVELEALRKQLQDTISKLNEHKPPGERVFDDKCKKCREREKTINSDAPDRQRQTDLIAETKRLKSALDRKGKEVEELREEIILAFKNIDALKDQVVDESVKAKLDLLEEENKKLQDENANLKMLEQEGIAEELQSLQQAIEDAEVKLLRLKREKEDLKKKLEESEMLVFALTTEKEMPSSGRGSLNGQLKDAHTQDGEDDSLSDESRELQSQLEDKKAEIDRLTKQLDLQESSYLQSVQHKDEQISLLRETLQVTEETCQKLKENLEQRETDAEELGKQLEEQQSKIVSNGIDIQKTLEIMCQNSVESIGELKKENEELKARLKSAMKSIEKTKESNAHDEADLGKRKKVISEEPDRFSKKLSSLKESRGPAATANLLDWLISEGIRLGRNMEVIDKGGNKIKPIKPEDEALVKIVQDILPGKDINFLSNFLNWGVSEGLCFNEKGLLTDNKGHEMLLVRDEDHEIRCELQRLRMQGDDKNTLHLLRWLITEGIHFDEQDQLVDGHGNIIQAATNLGYQFTKVVQALVADQYTERNIDNMLRWVVKEKPRVDDAINLVDNAGHHLILVREDVGNLANDVLQQSSHLSQEDTIHSVHSVVERGIKILPDGNFMDKYGKVYKHHGEKDKSKKLQEELQMLKDKIDSLESANRKGATVKKLEVAEEQLFLKELENDKLRKEIDESDSKMQEYEKELNAINQSLQQLAESRDRVIETAKREKMELMEKVRKEERKFKDSVENMSGLIEKLNLDKSNLEDELSQAKDVIARLKSKSKELQDEVNVEIDKQASLEDERKRWDDMRQVFEEELNRLRLELKEKEELIEELGKAKFLSRSRATSDFLAGDEYEGEIRSDKNIEVKKLLAENQLLRSKYVSLEDETTATTKIVADMERGHGHLTGTLRCHLVLQKPATAKLLENSLKMYNNEHENLKKKFEMVEAKYDKEGNYSSRRDFARELFENASASINNIQSILDQGLIKVEDDLEKDFTSEEDFKATDYKARLWIMRRRLSDVEKRHRELQLKAEELGIRLDAKTAEFEVTQDELEDATRDLETSETSMSKLRRELGDCLKENSQLKDALSRLQQEHKIAVESTSNETEESKVLYFSSLEEKEKLINSLRLEIDNLKSSLTGRESELMEVSHDNSQRRVEMEKQKSRIMELEGLLRKVETQNDLLQKQIESMRAGARYHHNFGTIHLLRDDLKKLWNENADLKEQLLKKQRIINDVTKDLRTSRTETSEQRSLGEKLEKRLMESGKKSEISDEATAKIAELKEKLTKSDTERFKIEEEKYKLEIKYEKESAASQEKINELVAMNEQLVKQIESSISKGERSMTYIKSKSSEETQLAQGSESTDSLEVFTVRKPVSNVLEASDDSLAIYSGSKNEFSVDSGDSPKTQIEELREELYKTEQTLKALQEENLQLNEKAAEREKEFKSALSSSISESEKIVKEQGESMQTAFDERAQLRKRIADVEKTLGEKDEELRKTQESATTIKKKLLKLEQWISKHQNVLIKDIPSDLMGEIHKSHAKIVDEGLIDPVTQLPTTAEKFELPHDFYSEGDKISTRVGSPTKIPMPKKRATLSSKRGTGTSTTDGAIKVEEEQMRAAIQTVDILELEVSKLKLELKEAREAKAKLPSVEQENVAIKAEVERLNSEISDMTIKLSKQGSLMTEITKLKYELKGSQTLKKKIAELESENFALKDDIAKLNSRINDLTNKVNKKSQGKAEVTKLKQELKDAKEESRKLSELESSMKQKINSLNSHIKDLTDKLEKQSADVLVDEKVIQSTHENLHNDIEVLQQELNSKKSEIEFLKLELNEVQSSKMKMLQETKSQQSFEGNLGSSPNAPGITVISPSSEGLMEMHGGDSEESELLRKAVRTKDEEIIRLNEQLDQMSKDWETAELRSVKLEEELSEIRKQLTKSERQLHEMHVSKKESKTLGVEKFTVEGKSTDEAMLYVETLEAEVQEKEVLIQNLREDYQRREEIINSLETRVKSLETVEQSGTLSSTEEGILKKQNTLLQTSLAQSNKNIKEMQNENVALQSQISELTKSTSVMQAELEQLHGAHRQLAQVEEMNNRLKEDLMTAWEDMEKLKVKLEEEKKSKEIVLVELESEKRTMHNTIQSLEGELRSKIAEGGSNKDTESKQKRGEQALELVDVTKDVTDSNQSRILQLEKELQFKTDEIQELRQQSSTLQEKISVVDALMNENSSLRKETEQSQKRLNQAVTIIQESKQFIQQNPEGASLKEKLDTILKNLADPGPGLHLSSGEEIGQVAFIEEARYKEHIEHFQREIRSLEFRVKETQMDLSNAILKSKTLEIERDDLLRERNNLQELNASLKTVKDIETGDANLKRITELQSNVCLLEATLTNLKGKNENLLNQISVKDNDITSYLAEISTLSSENQVLREKADEVVDSPRSSVGSLDSDSSLRDSEKQFILDSSKDWKQKLLSAYRELKDKSVEIATLRMNLECRNIEAEYEKSSEKLEATSGSGGKQQGMEVVSYTVHQIDGQSKERIQLLEKELEEKELRLTNLQAELQRLRLPVMEAEERGQSGVDERAEKQGELEEKLVIQRKRIDDLLTENGKKDDKINELQTSLQERSQAVHQLSLDLDKLEEKYRHEVMTRQGWLQERDDLTNYKDSKIRELQSRIAATEGEIRQLKDLNNGYEVERVSLQHQIEAMKKGSEMQVESLRHTSLVAEPSVKGSTDIHQLREEMDLQKQRYELEIKSLKSSLGALKAEHIGSLKGDHERIASERLELQITVTQMEEDLARKQGTLDEMYTRNRFLEIELSNAQSRIGELNEEIAVLEEDIRRLSER